MNHAMEDPSHRPCSMWSVHVGRPWFGCTRGRWGPLWPTDPPLPSPPGFKETAFLYAISSAGLTHALAKACSAGRMERCTCDEAPDLENREAWQWGGCGDNLKYSSKFVKEFLGRRSSKDLRARVDFHNNLVGVKASRAGPGGGKGCRIGGHGTGHEMVWVQLALAGAQSGKGQGVGRVHVCLRGSGPGEGWGSERRCRWLPWCVCPSHWGQPGPSALLLIRLITYPMGRVLVVMGSSVGGGAPRSCMVG